jgi:PAS domain S-box-containing protein
MKKAGKKTQKKGAKISGADKPRSRTPESQKKSKPRKSNTATRYSRLPEDLDNIIRNRTLDWMRANTDLQMILSEQTRLAKDLAVFRKLMDLSNDALFVVDPQSGRILDVNGNASRSLGYTREELLALRITDISTALRDAGAWKEFVAEIARKTSVLRESEHRRKDGSTFPVEVSLSYVSLEGISYVIGVARDITERKRKEAIARQNEERLLSIAETVTDVIYRLNPEGTVTYVSPSLHTVLGFTVEETEGKHFTDFIHPDDLEKAVHAYNMLLHGTSLMNLDLRILRKEGSAIFAELNIIPIMSGGRLTEIQGIIHDISERKRHDEAMHKAYEEAEMFRRLVESSDQAIGTANLDSSATYGNAALLRMLDIPTLEAFQSHSFKDFYAEEDLKILVENALPVVLSGQSWIGEIPLRSWLGRRIPTIHNLHAVRNNEGTPVAFANIITDISERKQSEEILKESEERFRAVFESARDGILIADIESLHILAGNAAILEMLGYSAEELLSLTVLDIHPGVDERSTREEFSVAASREKTIAHDMPVKKKDGSVFLADISSALITLSGKQCVVGIFRDVTLREKAEKAVRESEERMRSIADAVSDVIYRIGRDARFTYVSPSAEQVLGFASNEMIGKHFTDYVHENDLRTATDAYQRLLAGEPVRELNIRICTNAGGFIHAEANAVPIKHDDTVVEIQGIFRDVSERKKAAETSQRSYDAQVVISELLRISLTNHSLSDILQRALDLILSLEWLSFKSKGCIYLADNGGLFMAVQKNMDAHEVERCTRIPSGTCICGRAASAKEMVFADQIDERHVIVHEGESPHGHYCIPLLSKNTLLGVINVYVQAGHQKNDIEVRFLHAVSDALSGIIERKRAEDEREKLLQELKETLDMVVRSKREWEETFDSISDPIYIADDEYTIVRANRAFASYLDLNIKDIINKKCYILLHGTSTPPIDCPHAVCLQTREPASNEFSDLRTRRVFHLSAFPYRSPREEMAGSIMVMSEITGEREREMKMIISERLAALGQMAAGIAHEINNPLAAILGCAEGLLNRVKQGRFDPDLFLNYLNIIDEEVVRCKGITTDMLSFVRKSTYEAKDVDINSTIEKTLEIIGFQGRLKEIDVMRKFGEKLPPVRASEGELRQVFLAIITNALDAMQDRGTLTLETGIGAETVFLKISDTGSGIRTENLSRIFDPFFTTKGDLGGTGLGLSIASKIISSHGGTIDVVSDEGKGTAFTINLPLTPKKN